MYIENSRVSSLFPIARRVLIENLMDCSDVVENMVKQYLSFKVTGSGNPIEYYIIHTMKQLHKRDQVLFLQMRNIHEEKPFIYQCIIRHVEDLINVPLGKPLFTTLYIPVNPRYPAIDCLIYDKDLDAIIPIQITLNQYNHKNSYKEWKSKYQGEWDKVFKCKSIMFVWLAGIVKNKTKLKDEKYFVSDFESLSEVNKSHFQIFKVMKEDLNTKAKNYTDGTITEEVELSEI